MNPPVAWAAINDDGDIAWIGYTQCAAADAACGRRIVPLYLHQQPTLTDAEREAGKWALGEAVWSYNPDCGDHPDTLRRLLTRMSL